MKKRQRKMVDKGMAKARTRDSMQEVAKLTHLVDGRPRIIAEPPLIVPIADLLPKETDQETFEAQLKDLLGKYRRTLETDRRFLLEQYEYADMARKVVGVGSVGTRCWIVLMLGRDESDPLFLQVKEADASVLSRFVGASKYTNMGQRVVAGQRLMQASSDIFLGWQRAEAGLDGKQRDFYVRQLRDWKYSIAIEALIPHGMRIYGQACGWALARAHARSGDRIAIAAYLGGSDVFDQAITQFASRVRRPERTRPPRARGRRRLRTAHRRTRHVRSGWPGAAQACSGSARNWPARPGQEHLTMTAEPTQSPVTEAVRSLEVRWIFPGQLEAAVAGWFGRFPARAESREDTYLLDPQLRGLSVKVRGGGALEVKVYRGSPGILEVAGRARGRLESWQKWSFPFSPPRPDAPAPAGWTPVRKRRRISRFSLAGGQVVARAPGLGGEPRCEVELTEVRARGQDWWTLGFEATGPADLLRSALEATAALVFAQALPGGVEPGPDESRSYAQWLGQWPGAENDAGA